jgi:hypothetical protein
MNPSPEQQADDRAAARRLRCLELQSEALALGDHDGSMRSALARLLSAGRYTVQSEGGDCTAERALMQYAAVVTKAIGIALVSQKRDVDEHDATLHDHEASVGLLGLSAMIEAAPTLIDAFDHAGVDLRSETPAGDDDAKPEAAQ